MASILGTMLRNINRQQSDRLNILCLNKDERLQSILALTGHNFLFLSHPNIPSWNKEIKALPLNCSLLQGKEINDQFKLDTFFDLILCQDRAAHYNLLMGIAKQFGAPMIMAEYSLSHPNMNPYQVEALANEEYNHSVFESEFLANSWGFDVDDEDIDAIPQGIDQNVYHGWKGGDGKVLSIVDNFPQRDSLTGFSAWKNITTGLPVNIRGNSPGLSTPAKSEKELVALYKNCSVFLNTSSWVSCPSEVLEAMCVGCPVVTTATTILPDIIENGVNGYISNDEDELKKRTIELLENPELGKEMGEKARQTIVDKFSAQESALKWDAIFRKVVGQVSCAFRGS